VSAFTHRLGALRRPRGLAGTPLAPAATCTDDCSQQNAGNGLYLPPWIYPPINWENIDQLAYQPLPAIGAQITILSLVVPPGRNGIIRKVACNFVGGGWVEGSGDVIWQILVDNATPPGANSYSSILGSLGSPASPVEIPGFRVYENQTITFIAQNVAVILAAQKVGARLIGYFYPREAETGGIWV